MNRTYRVTFSERQKDGSVRIMTRTAIVESRQAVIDWYALEEPDIVSYDIEEIS